MAAPDIHFRIWREGWAGSLCAPLSRGSTTSPNADKVTCKRCQTMMQKVT